MKRFKNLYPQIYDFRNLLVASQKAQRGKRFRREVAEFNLNFEREILRLQRELKTLTYCHGGYRQFIVHEGKKRTISAAPYRDRIVHHALCNVIEPIFDRSFISDSYACRKGKGTHAAVNRLKSMIERYPYYLKIDIQKYFQTIRQDVLFSMFERKIGDRSVLWLLKLILDSYEESHRIDECGNMLFDFDGPLGIPIGNLTSQFFANVYLNAFDRFVKQSLGMKAYLRYVDDMLLLHDSKKGLYEVKNEISDYLETQLGLSIHENRACIFPTSEGIDFLGYRVFSTHVLVRKGNGHRFEKRFKILRHQFRRKQKRIFDVSQSVVSWIGHVAHANSWGLRTALLSKAVL